MNVLRIPPQQSTLISRSLVAKGTKTSPCHAMAQLSYPSPTVLEKGNPDAAVIYLHGLGGEFGFDVYCVQASKQACLQAHK
eukprot:1159031-Pelagomonas_calceolata.AAC.5